MPQEIIDAVYFMHKVDSNKYILYVDILTILIYNDDVYANVYLDKRFNYF